MNCLCCGKPLTGVTDETVFWHKTCVRKFFGTAFFPNIEIDKKTLELLAIESTGKGLTVPGVQKKLSLHLISDNKKPRLTIVNYPTGYIFKPQVDDFENLPEAEWLVMSMADVCGIKTVPHALIKTDDGFSYITRRVDRVFGRDSVKMLAMEDFCQLDGRLTADKYKGSYECCAKIIEKYSSRAMLDLSELFIRLVFCFATGNSDMHLKNFSLIETDEESNTYILSPAYDLLPVNLIMPEDNEEFALTMNGKKRNFHKNDFLTFAENSGISKASAVKMINSVLSKETAFTEMIESSLLTNEQKEQFILLVHERCRRLK